MLEALSSCAGDRARSLLRWAAVQRRCLVCSRDLLQPISSASTLGLDKRFCTLTLDGYALS